MSEPLTDTSPMPWGKHKGDPMSEVPADYLHFMWHNGLYGKGLKSAVGKEPVATYIHENLVALKQEYPDGIWT